MDEIFLADDSVLECLKSLSVPSSSLRRADGNGDNAQVSAAPGLELVAAVNPGGDYGKRSSRPHCGTVSRKSGFLRSLLGPVRIMGMDFHSNHPPIQFSFHPFPTKLVGTEI